MGIHYDYKSTRGAKKMEKPLTLDMITDPKR